MFIFFTTIQLWASLLLKQLPQCRFWWNFIFRFLQILQSVGSSLFSKLHPLLQPLIPGILDCAWECWVPRFLSWSRPREARKPDSGSNWILIYSIGISNMTIDQSWSYEGHHKSLEETWRLCCQSCVRWARVEHSCKSKVTTKTRLLWKESFLYIWPR